MFRGVAATRDWPATGMSSQRWLTLPATTVAIAELVATQPGVLFQALLEPGEPVGGDPLPHVIHWQGRMYLEDGHHRVTRALIDGHHTIEARVLTVERHAL
jgi:hypothetical protein